MPSDRTLVTEIATGLGTLGLGDLESALAQRPSAFVNLTDGAWQRVLALRSDPGYAKDFSSAFANGAAFLEAESGLAGRVPRRVEWTGGRRDPGDGAVPADLRIDHVYLVSCKYWSGVLHNRSPARLFEALLTNNLANEGEDWFARTAPAEYQALYAECASSVPDLALPARAIDMTVTHRRALSPRLKDWPTSAVVHYQGLCKTASEASVEIWKKQLADVPGDLMLWRVLRIAPAPYFILGADRFGAVRLRIDTPWEWRNRFEFRRFSVEAEPAGQPRATWIGEYREKGSRTTQRVDGHVEIRWSHGRFKQRPEAKIYLGTPHGEVPGYNPL